MMRSLDDWLLEASEDYVGLWQFIHDLEEDYPDINSMEARKKALATVKELIRKDLIQPGNFVRKGKKSQFELWNLSPEETMIRINKEWDALGREPTIADIVWFITTEKGDSEVDKIKNSTK